MNSTVNLMDIQLALAEKYLSTDVISQYECMRSQNQIMSNIKQMLQKKKQPENSYDLANIEASTISHVNMTHFFDDSLTLGKSKFTEQFEQSLIVSAMKQVKQNCSRQCYDTIKQHIENSKFKQFDSLQKKVQKYKQECEQLSSQQYILKLQKTNIEKELQRCKKIIQSADEDKKILKKKTDYVLEKENRIYKLQISFAFKQKINIQLKKRYQRLRENNSILQKKIEGVYSALDEIWSNICIKMDSVQCPGNCWKKQVMSRCKNQLVEQRKIAKQQSGHIQKQYEVMNMVSSQFKKIFHDPEAGTNKHNNSILSGNGSEK